MCSHTCGTGSVAGSSGSHTRTRSVDRASAFGGVLCGAVTESRPCNTHACPIDCITAEWGVWSGCSTTCDEGTTVGTHTRYRVATTQNAYGGAACPTMTQKKACNNGPCPVHCEVTEWSTFSACTKSCGGGLKDRHRTVTTHALHGGYACPYLGEYAACNEQPCPGDCVMETWSTWTTCTSSCGSGSKTRTRAVTTPAEAGGLHCPTDLWTVAGCNSHPCPIDCQVDAWTAFSACSATCGSGTKTRHRSVLVPAAYDGVACESLSGVEACNTHACPVDCVVGQWSLFSECDKECGGGTQTRTRQIVTAALGGAECPLLLQSAECNTLVCQIDCVVTAFSGWTQCTKSCQGGIQQRTRTVTTASEHGGAACPNLEETQACEKQPCPEDCHVSGWHPWSECTKECGGGVRTRFRNITNPADDGGMACPPQIEEEPCNLHHCACSHVACSYNTVSKKIEVHHHATLKGSGILGDEIFQRYGAELMGSQHLCGYNYATSACECRCHNPTDSEGNAGSR